MDYMELAELNVLLRELVKQRGLTSHSTVTGKGIIAELIIKAHKKECK